MANEKRLIDANELMQNIEAYHNRIMQDPEISNQMKRREAVSFGRTHKAIRTAQPVDAVEVKKYNDLREAFIDFVCSGVHNPAPYCKNRCAECVDSYGWCTYRRCNGFNPDRERKNNDAEN